MTTEPTQNTVTQLLVASRSGDISGLERLLPLVYAELRQVAQRQMQGENTGHTLQATALVHEAFLRLSGSNIEWQDRVHFFALAASTMRHILVDHAKARRRKKRGGGAVHVPLEDALHAADNVTADLAALDEALTRLAGRDERKARVVELHYFAGLTYEEIAEALRISAATVDRDLRFAKAWLFTELRDRQA
jgi:RNA polymerase sigma factor (TIGR02999 family)